MPKFAVSFRIMKDDLTPEEISGALGLKPTESHRKGDARPAPKGREYAPFSEGLWCLASESGDEATLEQHLDDLLKRLTPQRAALDSFKKRGYRQDVFVGVFSRDGNTGFAVSPSMQSRLLQLGLELNFDVYG